MSSNLSTVVSLCESKSTGFTTFIKRADYDYVKEDSLNHCASSVTSDSDTSDEENMNECNQSNVVDQRRHLSNTLKTLVEYIDCIHPLLGTRVSNQKTRFAPKHSSDCNCIDCITNGLAVTEYKPYDTFPEVTSCKGAYNNSPLDQHPYKVCGNLLGKLLKKIVYIKRICDEDCDKVKICFGPKKIAAGTSKEFYNCKVSCNIMNKSDTNGLDADEDVMDVERERAETVEEYLKSSTE